jgi:hypothetical protein
MRIPLLIEANPQALGKSHIGPRVFLPSGEWKFIKSATATSLVSIVVGEDKQPLFEARAHGPCEVHAIIDQAGHELRLSVHAEILNAEPDPT